MTRHRHAGRAGEDHTGKQTQERGDKHRDAQRAREREKNMTYYKALAEKHDHFTGWTTVTGELLTERERNTRFRYLSSDIFKPVEVSKKKTVFIFGARCEVKEEGR